MATDGLGRPIGTTTVDTPIVAALGRGDIQIHGRGIVDVPDATSVGVI